MAFNYLTILFVVIFLQLSLIDGRALFHDEIGQIEGNRFINDRFHLSVEIPTNWTVMTRKNMEKLLGLVVTENLVIPVLGLSQNPVGTSDRNPNIMAVAAKRTHEPNLCSPLMDSRKIVTLFAPSATYKEDCREVTLKGKTFAMHELTMIVNSSTKLYETQYNYLTKDEYFITFTLAYFNTEEKAILDGIMESLSFSL